MEYGAAFAGLKPDKISPLLLSLYRFSAFQMRVPSSINQSHRRAPRRCGPNKSSEPPVST
jgi:hypothetical protein